MPTEMRMRAVFDCSADELGELSFSEGDILVDVTESGEDGWYTGRIENTTEKGLFPYNYVEPIVSESTPTRAKEEEKENSPEIMTTIPITAINIPTATVKTLGGTGGGRKGSSSSIKDDKNSLPGFPALDAFEAAMSGGKGSKATATTTSTSWTPPATVSHTPPPIISPKPKLATLKDTTPAGLGIKMTTPPAISEKPLLKSFNLKQQDTSPTRLRSWSTSSVSNNTETEKTLRPSQLLNGKGTRSALELALSKGSPGGGSIGPQQSNLRSNSFSKPGNLAAGIALPGMANIKLNSSISNDVEEEDGFQMIKPSQLRQRQQQQQSSPKPIISKSSASISSFKSANTPTTTTIPSWKKSTDISSPALKPAILKTSTSSPRLEEVKSSNPMPRLPSRPTSTARRRSRNSRTSSLTSSPSTSTNTTPSINKASLPPVKEANNEKAAPPPILKPKPQIAPSSTTAAAATVQPHLPPRPSNKSRSTSNPPPIQPKPAAMSSIEILLSKNAAEKKSSSLPATAASTTTTTPPSHVSKPVNYQTNKVALPGFTKANATPSTTNQQRPNLDSSWRSDSSSATDSNLKPSALLNSRARSATNPTSNTDFTSMLMSKPNKPVTTPRFVDFPVPAAAAVIETAVPKKKATPPPPPPSRLPKNKSGMDEATKHRYEILFESIHDHGYVDGETARFIWLRSKLSNEELSRVWKECDPEHKGLLDKHGFIDGMGRIDELLSNKQQQQVV